MASKNYFMNGTTELLVLSLLKAQDRYVYEIVKAIEDLSGGLLDISQNTVYTATYKLESDGMISEYPKLVGKKRTRIYYHIEPKGLEYLSELQEIYLKTTEGINKVIDNIKNH